MKHSPACEVCRLGIDPDDDGHDGPPADEPRRECPDSGRCWHGCDDGPCWRVANAAPLSIAGYPDDRWPDDVKRANGVEVPERVAISLLPYDYDFITTYDPDRERSASRQDMVDVLHEIQTLLRHGRDRS